ncbi:MAG: choice-of-anchor L domain-containing protein [Bacteroidetes bacterium]|nr:choice-of-anchor L domain-containing protein [Bacteroidota bacterium]
MKKIVFFVTLIGLHLQGFSQLTVNNTLTPTQLVNNILLGAGVTATNITYTGATSSRSSFNCAGACNLNISNGILLSSGEALNPMSPASYHHSTDVGSAGDAQLNSIVSPNVTQDAAILEFDFSVAADSVKFEYVFGSEEYNDYANTGFNDVFAFFISGPGIVGVQNIALIPGTTTPVSINNVNNGGPVAGAGTGPCMNCTYFVDNVTGGSVYLDAFTTVLTAKAAVLPCQTYHIKMAIADVSDGIYDSGVFLKGGSFSALGQISLFANGVAQSNNATVYACTGTSVNLCLNPSTNYNWSSGATTQCITVDEANLAPGGNYQAYVVGPAGCFAFTTTVNVQFITPSATITPSGPTALCPGSNVTLTANAGNTYLWNTGATTQAINVATAGTYTVTVSNGPNCSAVSAPVSVTVGNAAAQISGVLSLCNGANTTLTANAGQSYLWNTGAVTQSINVAAAGNYTVTVTQAGNCTASATAAVLVNANPVPAITGTLSFCQGSNTSINAGAGFASYLWNTGAATQNLNVIAGGTYTVTVTSAAGCSGSTSAVVVANPLPVPVISGTTAFCAGGNTTINAGAGYSSYLWNTAASTQNINVSTGGNYTVTVTNANSCSASASVVVTVNPLPTPNILGTFAFCQGSNSIINAGAGYSSYLWSTGAVTQNITVSNANTYTVTVTDANGCSNSDSQLISVNPNPIPAITGVTAICQGTSTTLNAGAGFNSYLWSTGATGVNLNVNATGTYSVTVTNANGCTGTSYSNVTVNPLPVPAITGTTSFCLGQNSNLNAGGGFTSYLWNTGAVTQLLNVTASGNYIVTVSNGFGCTATTNTMVTANPLPAPAISGPTAICIGNNATLNAGGGYASYLWNTGAITPTISASAAGNYTVTVTSAAGCTGSVSAALNVNPLPTPSISGITTICQGVLTTLDAGAGYSSYLWSNGNTGQTISTGLAGPVTVTVTDINGCSAPTATNITVNALPTPIITGVTAFCQGQSSTLDAGFGYAAYLWNTGAVTRNINVSTAGNYTVTVTSFTGCQGVDNELVTVNNNPAPVIAGPSGICQGTSTALSVPGAYASYLWNTGATTAAISVSAAGNYAVTVTTAAGCSGTNSTSMVINPLPTPVITGTTSICQGTTTLFDAGAGYTSYLWSNGATTQTIAPGTAGTYTVTVIDANTCTNSTNRSLLVNPLPIPAITGTTAFCQGDNSNLNAGAGFSSYLWSNGAATQVINVTSAGNYIVTVTDNNSCSASTNTFVTVNPNPVPVILGGTGICIGTSTTLNVPGAYASYLWNTGATTSNISVSTAGNYAVTVTSAFGCSGSGSTSMIINQLPTPIITGISEICQGTNTSFDAGAGYSAYLWSNGATSQIINPGVAGNYTVTVTDANGCKNDAGIALLVNALPTPAIAGNLEFCQGDNSNLNAGIGYAGYLWSNGATSSVINVSTAGNYVVTVTDGNGCSGSTNSIVVVNPLPNPVITGSTAICQGTTSTLNAGNYSSYSWSDGSTSATLTVGVAGNYAVTVTDNNGCVNSTSTTLIVNELPTASISGTTAICFGQSTPVILNFTGTGPFSYIYNNGLVNSTLQTANSNSATFNISPGATTNFTLVSVSDANCIGTVSGNANIVVNSLPVPVITGDLSICNGEITTLNATPGFTSYTWSNSSNAASTNTGTAGIYTVSVIDNNGCQGTSAAVNLVVNAVPVISFTNDTSLTCSVPEINFTNLSQFDAGSSFSWNFGDGGISNELNPSHLYFNPGTYPISLVITTPAGCSANSTQNVDIMFFPLPVADFVTAPGVTNVFNGKIGFVDRSEYAISWLWDFGDGATSLEQNPYHYYNEIGDYKVVLRVTNIAGCEDITEDVVVINPYFIPNAFTPNGDGVNDVFYYSGYDLDVSRYNMKIFNRWGQLVFTGQDENDNWNGMTNDNVTAPQGTYIYRLLIKTKGGQEHTFNGQVNLIR